MVGRRQHSFSTAPDTVGPKEPGVRGVEGAHPLWHSPSAESRTRRKQLVVPCARVRQFSSQSQVWRGLWRECTRGLSRGDANGWRQALAAGAKLRSAVRTHAVAASLGS